MSISEKYKKWQYDRYMKSRAKEDAQRHQAARDEQRYKAMAAAEKQKLEYERARSQRNKVSGGGWAGTGFTGIARGMGGAASGALGALVGDMPGYQQSPRRSPVRRSKRKRSKKGKKRKGRSITVSY